NLPEVVTIMESLARDVRRTPAVEELVKGHGGGTEQARVLGDGGRLDPDPLTQYRADLGPGRRQYPLQDLLWRGREDPTERDAARAEDVHVERDRGAQMVGELGEQLVGDRITGVHRRVQGVQRCPMAHVRPGQGGAVRRGPLDLRAQVRLAQDRLQTAD